MELTPLVLTALVAMVVGAVVGWLAGRARVGALDARLQERETQLGQAAKRLEAHDAQLAAARTEQTRLTTEITRLEGEVATEKRLLIEKQKLLEEFDQRLREAFRATSQEVVASGTQQLVELATARFDVLTEQAKAELEQRRSSIDGLVQPMQEKLGEVHRVLESVNVERVKSQEALEQQLRMLTDQSLQLAGETRNLVSALRAPQARGARCSSDPTHRLPRRPGRRGRAGGAPPPRSPREGDPHPHRAALGEELRERVRGVARLRGDVHPGRGVLRRGVPARPGADRVRGAEGDDPDEPDVLYHGAQGGGVRLAANLEEIRDLGIELYDRMATVAEHFAGVGRGLKGAFVEAYDKTIGSLETRVLPTARKLKAKGAGGRKEIEVMEPLHLEPRPMVAR